MSAFYDYEATWHPEPIWHRVLTSCTCGVFTTDSTCSCGFSDSSTTTSSNYWDEMWTLFRRTVTQTVVVPLIRTLFKPAANARWFDCFRLFADVPDREVEAEDRVLLRRNLQMVSVTQRRRRKRRRFVQMLGVA